MKIPDIPKSKIFSFKSKGKAKPIISGQASPSTSIIDKDGNLIIIDNFVSSPKGFEQALKDPLMYTDPKAYSDNIRRSIGLHLSLDQVIKLLADEEKRKNSGK